jgi:hypothetical protein
MKEFVYCRQRSSANSSPSGCCVAKMGVGKLAGFLSSRVELLEQRKHQITRRGSDGGRDNIGIGSYTRPEGGVIREGRRKRMGNPRRW